jgi:hypothetical protein
MMLVMSLVAIVGLVALCIVGAVFYCRVCPVYLKIAAVGTRDAPNRLNPMTNAERAAYKKVHGPFPDEADVRAMVKEANDN